MGDISTSCTYQELAPNGGVKLIKIDTPATTDSADTVALTLLTYGIRVFKGIYGCTHTTANSIVVTEAPTTAVSSGTLTITVGGSNASDQIRSYLVWGV